MNKLWKEVISSIEKLSETGCYERINRFMSFLTVDYLRKKLVSNVRGEVIIDAGSGPGNLSSVACRRASNLKKLVLIDPSGPMVMQALKTLRRTCSRRDMDIIAILGIFESLPLKDSSVDSIITSFAFRDAINYSIALNEFWRILKPNGILGILDLYRPSNNILGFVVRSYLTVIPPLGSLILGCPKMIKAYWLLKKTIDNMLTEVQLIKMLKERFEVVKFKSFYPGVGLWIATSKRSEFCQKESH